MASKLLVIILSIIFLSTTTAFSQSKSANTDPPSGDINRWCDMVPHPNACKFFMAREPHIFKPQKKSDFRRMTIQVALDRAKAAQARTWRWGENCTTHKERAAWVDCARLYDHTIIQLNRSLQALTYVACTDFDVQTWLSTALTNLETCRAGSDDLNLTSFIWPHISYNVSDLISNGLAINDGLLEEHLRTGGDEFPSWFTSKDRILLQSRKVAKRKALFVVAKDHTGQFRTVKAAIDAAARSKKRGRKVIYIKRGVYRENIYVNPYTSDIMLLGDGIKSTVITSSRSVRSGYTTYNSATAGIDGLHFIAREITFRNTAGPMKGQAVALRSGSDLSVFYKCAFYGYQDTLFVHSQRQFYKMCYIFGTIDIIFGNAAAIFQNCMIYVRKPIIGQMNVITAQGRGDPNQNTGIVIHSSRIVAAPDLAPYTQSVTTYLGRPWQPYSRTIIMKSYLGPLINLAGWLPWSGNNFLNTLYYAEYRNIGPGSKLRKRVRWAGFHIITRPSIASKFTVGNFIAGRTWLPATGVPFRSGL